MSSIDIQPGENPPEILNSTPPEIFCRCKFLNVVPALLADTAVFRTFVKKMLPPDAIFKLKIHVNAYAAGASPRTPLGEITELPRPPAGFREPLRRRKRRRKREVIAFFHFFFII